MLKYATAMDVKLNPNFAAWCLTPLLHQCSATCNVTFYKSSVIKDPFRFFVSIGVFSRILEFLGFF